MDCLSRYIQNGKVLHWKKIIAVFLGVALLCTLLLGGKLAYTFYQSDFQNFLKSIPVIDIQDKTVLKPENTTWKTVIPDSNIKLCIDTTENPRTEAPEVGLLLTRKNLIFAFNGQIKEYELPQEKTTIDTPFLQQMIRVVIINTCLFIGIILLFFFLLGYGATISLASLILWGFKRQTDKIMIRKAALIGWVSVLLLDFVLIFGGYGFSLLTGVVIATTIALLGLYLSKSN